MLGRDLKMQREKKWWVFRESMGLVRGDPMVGSST